MRAWILLALAISQGAWALAPCERETQVGSWCEVNIEQLHPTQGGVGQIQVDNTQAELRMSLKKKQKSLTIGVCFTLLFHGPKIY